MKVIRKYGNRKLYDVENSCYITLEEIRDILKNGDDIQVIDYKSKEDITNFTLKNVLHHVKINNENLISLITLGE